MRILRLLIVISVLYQHIIVLGFFFKKSTVVRRYKRTIISTRHFALNSNKNKNETPREKLDQQLRNPEYLLDCLTSVRSEDVTFEDAQKTEVKSRLLDSCSYLELRTILEKKGLQPTGDKTEMLTKILMHEINPELNYDAQNRDIPNLSYVTDEDVASGHYEIIPEEKRAEVLRKNLETTDADDLRFLRTDQNFHKRRPVLDGLVRKEIDIPQCKVRRTASSSLYSTELPIPCYVVQPNCGSQNWNRRSHVVLVLLPDHSGWQFKSTRIAADELSIRINAIVLVPDIYRDQHLTTSIDATKIKEWAKLRDNEQIFDDILSVLQYIKNEIPKRTISLSGIGYGGGRAMEAACDVYDIACWESAQQLLKIPKIMDKEWSAEVERQISAIHDNFNIFRTPITDKDISAIQPAEAKPPIPTEEEYDKLIDESMKQMLAEFEEEEAKEYAVKKTEDLKKEGYLGDDETAADIEARNDMKAPVITFNDEQLSLIQQGGDNGADFDAANNEVSVDWSNSEQKVDDKKPDIVDGKNDNNSSRAMEEYENSIINFKRMERRSQEELLTRLKYEVALTIEKSKSIDQRLLMNSHGSPVTPQDIAATIPMSVMAISPNHYDVNKVGQHMIAPTFVVSGKLDSLPNANEMDIRKLFKLFSERKEEILDYFFNEYDYGTSSFIANPKEDIDKMTLIVVFNLMKVWVDMFKSARSSDFTIAAGTIKRSNEAFVSSEPIDVSYNLFLEKPLTNRFVHEEAGYIDNERNKPKWS